MSDNNNSAPDEWSREEVRKVLTRLYKRIGRAADRGEGVRITAFELERLMIYDGAVQNSVENAREGNFEL